MKYRLDKTGRRLSALGFGCMRFPRKMGKCDVAETEKLVMRAIEQGVNYFDTAYIYPGSEAALGEILEKNGVRDKVYIATKLPHYLIRSAEAMEKIFREELERLRTDHIDYYLLHMLTDVPTWHRLKEMGIEDWIREKKAAGLIGQIGFSYHGNSTMFCSLLDEYDWDFTMIQYNYMDEHSQAGRRGLERAAEKGIPVMIMEPLRGGRLVSHLPRTATELFASHSRSFSPAQWAFRWLWDQKDVTVVLSGMNTMEMLEDNLQTADSAEVGDLSEEDQALLKQVVAAIGANMKVGCTGCGYCMPCPKNVDIPGTFSAYNRRYSEGRFASLKDYFMCTALRKDPTSASQCIGCGKCEKHCPQAIPIREKLAEATRELEILPYRAAKALVSRFAKF
ncbi:MAG: aldo/keto reductase [Clostridia bacterium]|nr:aldo/keto reductase [Clostridia bacterium]